MLLFLWRPRCSWTRIKGESDVEGGGGHGWVEATPAGQTNDDPEVQQELAELEHVLVHGDRKTL